MLDLIEIQIIQQPEKKTQIYCTLTAFFLEFMEMEFMEISLM